jgi:hypothetical protein
MILKQLGVVRGAFSHVFDVNFDKVQGISTKNAVKRRGNHDSIAITYPLTAEMKLPKKENSPFILTWHCHGNICECI